MALTEYGKKLIDSGIRNPEFPKTESDQNFKISMCRELMFAWEDAPVNVRPHLERVMCNVGMYQTQAIDENHVGAWMLMLGQDHEFFVGKLKD